MYFKLGYFILEQKAHLGKLLLCFLSLLILFVMEYFYLSELNIKNHTRKIVK